MLHKRRHNTGYNGNYYELLFYLMRMLENSRFIASLRLAIKDGHHKARKKLKIVHSYTAQLRQKIVFSYYPARMLMRYRSSHLYEHQAGFDRAFEHALEAHSISYNSGEPQRTSERFLGKTEQATVQVPKPNDFDLTLAQICQQAIQRHPECILLKWRQSTFTVEDVIRRASVNATNLKTIGVAPGTAVGVMLDNHPNHVSTLLALGLFGVKWVPLDRRFKSVNVKNILALVNVDLIIVEQEYRDVILGANPECAVENLDELIISASDEPAMFTHSDILPDDTRALMFTSGTTAATKAVVVTERMYTGAALFCAYASHSRLSC